MNVATEAMDWNWNPMLMRAVKITVSISHLLLTPPRPSPPLPIEGTRGRVAGSRLIRSRQSGAPLYLTGAGSGFMCGNPREEGTPMDLSTLEATARHLVAPG